MSDKEPLSVEHGIKELAEMVIQIIVDVNAKKELKTAGVFIGIAKRIHAHGVRQGQEDVQENPHEYNLKGEGE